MNATEAKPTLGPWEIREHTDRKWMILGPVNERGSQEVICWINVVRGFGDIVGPANARLVIAAPDLLAACNAMAAIYRRAGWPLAGPEAEVSTLVRAAIAKAQP